MSYEVSFDDGRTFEPCTEMRVRAALRAAWGTDEMVALMGEMAETGRPVDMPSGAVYRLRPNCRCKAAA